MGKFEDVSPPNPTLVNGNPALLDLDGEINGIGVSVEDAHHRSSSGHQPSSAARRDPLACAPNAGTVHHGLRGELTRCTWRSGDRGEFDPPASCTPRGVDATGRDPAR
ncbi:hypothetical protein LV779_35195 [Streptomyces thinghirensis]|nr:hypothetical protein [Streptomyces thinghirensis]